jgi:hypothetical protein
LGEERLERRHRGAEWKTWTAGEAVTGHVPLALFAPPEKERKLYFP